MFYHYKKLILDNLAKISILLNLNVCLNFSTFLCFKYRYMFFTCWNLRFDKIYDNFKCKSYLKLFSSTNCNLACINTKFINCNEMFKKKYLKRFKFTLKNGFWFYQKTIVNIILNIILNRHIPALSHLVQFNILLFYSLRFNSWKKGIRKK